MAFLESLARLTRLAGESSRETEEASRLLDAMSFDTNDIEPPTWDKANFIAPYGTFKMALLGSREDNGAFYNGIRRHVDLSATRRVALHLPHRQFDLKLQQPGTFKAIEDLQVAVAMDRGGAGWFALKPLHDRKLLSMPVKRLTLLITEYRHLDTPQVGTSGKFQLLKLFDTWMPSAQLEELTIRISPELQKSSGRSQRFGFTPVSLFDVLTALESKRIVSQQAPHDAFLTVLARVLARVPTIKVLRLTAVSLPSSHMKTAKRIVKQHPELRRWDDSRGRRVILEHVAT